MARQLRGLDQQPAFDITNAETCKTYHGNTLVAQKLRFDLIDLLYQLAFIQAYEASGHLFSD